jgi:hypothetical protein
MSLQWLNIEVNDSVSDYSLYSDDGITVMSIRLSVPDDWCWNVIVIRYLCSIDKSDVCHSVFITDYDDDGIHWNIRDVQPFYYSKCSIDDSSLQTTYILWWLVLLLFVKADDLNVVNLMTVEVFTHSIVVQYHYCLVKYLVLMTEKS